MQNNDRNAFVQLMTGVSVLYQVSFPSELMELYWQALASFDLATINSAIQAHIVNPDTGQFLPKPADLLRYLKGSSQAQALQAWTKVSTAISQVGAYQTVVFDDPLIHAVIAEMGGWIKLCQSTVKDLSFKGHEFQQRYRAYVLQPPARYPRALKGLLIKHNQQLGYEEDSLVFLGEVAQAKAVYQQGSDQMHLTQQTVTVATIKSLSSSSTFAPINPETANEPTS